MSSSKLFGTDGIRGRAGEGWLTPDAASAVGLAAGRVLAAHRNKPDSLRAVLGHDGRRSGPELEQGLARGLRAAGYSVRSAGLITTPGLATVARLSEEDTAIMVSASHNPAEDNGIKIFGARGEKLSDALEREIELFLAEDSTPAPNGDAPTIDESLDAAYIAALVTSISGLNLSGLKIVLDCANGAGSDIAPRVLKALGAELIAIGCSPDGDNINRDCGATRPEALTEAVKTHGANIGIALDGDGDRCILVDENAEIVCGDATLMICGRDLAERKGLSKNRIVATVMSNRGLHRALRDHGVQVTTVGVGDRQVVECLRREAIELGGEQSGHIIFGSDFHFIGDGTYTALRILDAMRRSKLALSELAAPFQAFPQVLINRAVNKKPPLDQLPEVQAAARAIEDELGDNGRVLLRYSGTESLARIMVEGPDQNWIQEKATELADLVVSTIASTP
ncbi:MAG: phosphoglucosamine mutase [Planctomycetota bacterium]